MNTPTWQAAAERSIRKMTKRIKPKQVKYFDWKDYGNNALINDGRTKPTCIVLNYSQAKINGQRL